MSNLGLVLDCTDPERLAGFWGPALGYVRLAAAGNYVLLVDQDGSRPKLLLQVPEPKSAKNRMHLDIVTPNIEAESKPPRRHWRPTGHAGANERARQPPGS